MDTVEIFGDWKPVANWPNSRGTFIGFDVSLTATGVCIMRRNKVQTFVLSPPMQEVFTPGQKRSKKVPLRGAARLAWFFKRFREILEEHEPTLVAVEGYAFGATSHAHSIGELGGALRLAAHACRLQPIIVPPNSLKLFATGKGDASKDVVIKEVFKRWGIDVNDNNEADAFVLSLIAHASLLPRNLLLSFQSKALEKILPED